MNKTKLSLVHWKTWYRAVSIQYSWGISYQRRGREVFMKRKKSFFCILNSTDKYLGRAAGKKSSSVHPTCCALSAKLLLHQTHEQCIKYSSFLNYCRFQLFQQETLLFKSIVHIFFLSTILHLKLMFKQKII